LGKRWVTKKDKRKEKQAAKQHKRLQKIRPWITEEYSESRRCRTSLQLAEARDAFFALAQLGDGF
jgi:hypothetical protein